MLTCKDVSKRFGDLQALDHAGFSISKGDIVALIGPSGAGKTTLLRCLDFLERADEGTLVFDETALSLPDATKKEIRSIRMRTGFVFQSYNLFLNKTALQNITEGLQIARKIPKKEAVEMAKASLEKVGLLSHADFYPHQLSGGQQQRVAIARALAPNPEIIYFDEPTSALDPELTKEVLGVMDILAKEGMTVAMVSHDLPFVKNLANQIVFMEDGRVVEENGAAAFFDSPKTERAAAFLQGVLH